MNGSDGAADLAATEAIHGMIPFAGHLGVEVLANRPAEVRTRLPHAPHLCTAGEIFHGGALMALADTSGAMCAALNLPEGAGGTATVESKTNFLRPARAANAVSRPLHAGKRFVIVETEIRDDEDRLVAKVTQTQAVL